MKQYKAVFIDWDDTIGDFRNAAHKAIEDIFVAYHLDRIFSNVQAFMQVYEPHNLELWALYGDDKVTKEYLSLNRFLWPIVQGLGGDETLMQRADLIDMAQHIASSFLELTTRYFALLPGAEQMVRYLYAKYPLTIVSNGFIEVQHTKINASGLKPLFKHIVLSEEVGYQKPNPKIFELALERNNLHADEVIMVGDSWYSDIQGAQRAGIDQLWIRAAYNDPLPEGQTATYIIPTNEQITTIL